MTVAQPGTPGQSPTAPPPSSTRLRFANAEYDPAEASLRVDGLPVAVEPRPLRLLAELLHRPGQVLSKDELFNSVWQGRATVDHVLANAVSKLRAALGPEAGARIVTVPRLGYRLQGTVQEVQIPLHHGAFTAGQPVPSREAYVLCQRLGSAAPPEVWLAKHQKLGLARVFKFASQQQHLALLQRELAFHHHLHQALGDREDLVPVLDTQLAAAPYFIECEDGGPSLARWDVPGSALDGMPREQRLELFLQLARTVADAHGAGVVHGDICPAHVLVQQQPFGWRVRLVGFGGSAGAPYRAPERLPDQPATVQCDVYALGLVLWQLLRGDLQRPLVTGWQREIGDELLCEDIAAATEGEPSRRLASAAVLIDRISSLPTRKERRLDELAERQREEAALRDRQRLEARRPWLLAAVAGLGAGLAASVSLGLRTPTSVRKTSASLLPADAVNEFLSKDFIGGLDVAHLKADAQVSMKAVLSRAAELAGTVFNRQPVAEAVIRGHIGRMFARASLFEDAHAQFRTALALAPSDLLSTEPMLLRLRLSYAAFLAEVSVRGTTQESLEAAERDIFELPAPERKVLSRDVDHARFIWHYQREEYAKALSFGRRMVEALHERVWIDPTVFVSRSFQFSDLLYRLGEYREASRLLEDILKGGFWGAAGPVERARTRICLARVKVAVGQTGGVEEELIQARDGLSDLLGQNEYHCAVANVELANLYDGRGEFGRSVEVLNDALAAMRGTLGGDNVQTRIVELNLAIAELNQGSPAQALGVLTSNRAWFVQRAGETGAVVQAIDFERARALTGSARPVEALDLLARLDAKRLKEATPALDWDLRLEAERARAQIASGNRRVGLAVLSKVLPQMEERSSSPWVIGQLKDLLEQAQSDGSA